MCADTHPANTNNTSSGATADGSLTTAYYNLTTADGSLTTADGSLTTAYYNPTTADGNLTIADGNLTTAGKTTGTERSGETR